MVDALGDGRQFGLDLRFAFEDKPAGTAGAVKLLQKELTGTVVVVSGDVLADVDIRSLVAYHRRNKAVATMALTTVERPEEFGIVGLDGEGRIVRFKEKPRTEEVFSNLINAGIYVLESRVLEDIPAGEKYDFSKQLFPKLLERGERLFGSALSGLWKDIGRPRDLLDANLSMAERRGKELHVEGAECSGNIVATSFEAKGCEIRGPAYIGEGAIIGSDSLLTSCAIGDNVGIGSEVILSDSFLMGDCILGDGCTIEGSLLGKGCLIGPGVSLINMVLGDGVRLEGPVSMEGQTLE
jgi:mannose-1-phosphate guanylyltransferase